MRSLSNSPDDSYGTRFAEFNDSLMRDSKDCVSEGNALAQFLKSKGVTNSSTVLDFGCGTGEHAILLDNLGFQEVGLDLFGAMI